MDRTTLQRAEHALSQACGIAFEALAAPIGGAPLDDAARAGAAAAPGNIGAAIRRAREADDASLPMGAFARELKRADWDKVAQLAANGLAGTGKDLQLAAWLLEAEIHRHGFSTVAGCLHLIHRLCEEYWDCLHPQADGDDFARRANIVSWINRKLPAAVRQVPVAPGPEEQGYAIADWERARRYEQQRHADPDGASDGPSPADLAGALAATSTELYMDMERDLSDALALLDRIAATLDERMGGDAPSLGAFGATLQQARNLVQAELHGRGARPHAGADLAPPAPAAPSSAADPDAAPAAMPGPAAAMSAGVIRDRADAYALLDQVATFLQRVEPHSPVPYLVRRAAEWGQLGAVELYRELFLRLQGQIHIYEIMGLVDPDQADHNR